MMHKEEEKSRMVCPFRVHGVTTPSATIPDIYTNLGNGINHDLCLRFVGEMDFNLNKLKHEIEKMEKPT